MNSRLLTFSFRWDRRARALALAALGLLLSSCTGCPQDIGTCNGGGGRNANLCLGFSLASPTIDGVIKGDSGWRDAFHYTLGNGNGTDVASAIVHGGRNTNTLFLGFEIHKDGGFNVNDAIVLAFDPDGTAANRRRIHIYPVFTTGAGAGGAAQKIDYWKGSDAPPWTDPNTAPLNPTPAWLGNNIKVTSDNVQGNHYFVEIAIPLVAGPDDPGINLPAGTDDFGFYTSILDAVETANSTNIVSEHSWPICEDPATCGTLVGQFIEETPTPDRWGNGTLGKLNNGVSVTKLFTNQMPDDEIELDTTTQNQFFASVENHMVDKNGAHVAAHGVYGEFRIKNYGIPSLTEWDLLPSSPNPAPSAAGMDIAGNSANIQTNWTLTAQQVSTYATQPAQCMRVEIFSKGPDTLIVQRYGWRNMHFVDTASPFDEKARIGVRGYRLPEGRREHEFLLTEYRYNTEKPSAWTSQLTNVTPFNGGGPFPQYVLRVPAEQQDGADISARITPPDVRIPRDLVKLPPGSGGDVRVKVTPGNIVTVFASGSIIRRAGDPGPSGRPSGPNGENVRNDRGERQSGYDGKFLLNDGDTPDTRVGAVIASTDGFKGVSFVIGRATTFQVPQGVSELAFGINDTPDGLKRESGEGFQLEVIQTPVSSFFRHTTTAIDRRTERGVTILPLGQNLPTWIICAQRKTGGSLTIHGKQYERYENVGCFGSIVKSMKGV
jgi:hypothetical protein